MQGKVSWAELIPQKPQDFPPLSRVDPIKWNLTLLSVWSFNNALTEQKGIWCNLLNAAAQGESPLFQFKQFHLLRIQ
jgi:hypothetical protein